MLGTRRSPGRPIVGEVGHPARPPDARFQSGNPYHVVVAVYQGRGRRPPPPPPTCDLMREMKKGRPRERRAEQRRGDEFSG